MEKATKKPNITDDISTKIEEENSINEIHNINGIKNKIPKSINGTEELDSAAREKLNKELEVLNLTIDTLSISISASIMNLRYLKWQRAKLLDQINNTDYAKDLQDLTDTLKFTSKVSIYVSAVFFDINNKAYREISSVKGADRNFKAIKIAWKAAIAALLNLIASIISEDNLGP